MNVLMFTSPIQMTRDLKLAANLLNRSVWSFMARQESSVKGEEILWRNVALRLTERSS